MLLNRRSIFLVLFFVSGACGLVYEIAWTRLFIPIISNTVLSVSAILLIPLFGVTATLVVAAALNLLIAVCAWQLWRKHDSAPRLNSEIKATSSRGPVVVLVAMPLRTVGAVYDRTFFSESTKYARS